MEKMPSNAGGKLVTSKVEVNPQLQRRPQRPNGGEDQAQMPAHSSHCWDTSAAAALVAPAMSGMLMAFLFIAPPVQP